jgi:dipeptidyl aminopeptidase/acylaminoacyl peptidase
MGYSFGGYHGPRICAFDKRYAACVCLGAMHWNVYDFVKGHAPADPRQTSASTFQFRWVVGAPDNATALEWAKKYTLEGVAEKVECPILILHGENDRIVPVADAKKLYERRALPGRQPPAWHRLHRRLAAQEHVSQAADMSK